MNGKVQFGLRLGEFPFEQEAGEVFRDGLFGYLDAVHELYDSAWIADHFFPWLGSVAQNVTTIEAMTTITYLAARYTNLKWGSIVLSQGYRHPALLAKMAATLQVLTGGRFILGIGAGWKENEYKAYGYDFPSPGTRIDQLEEAVQVIKAMLNQDSPSFHGKYYNIENAYNFPRPAVIPPILIGGGGRKKTLRVVAQYADWWNIPGGTPQHYAEVLEALRGHCQEVGRDYDSIVKTWLLDCVAVAPTQAEAERQAKASPMCGPDSVIGTPEAVAARLQGFVDVGVTHFMLRFADFPRTEGALLFAKEVLPRFR